MNFHIDAKPGDIAETILLPGDPLRAKFIAEHLMDNAVCYNEVRAMYGYTGFYNGKRVSVQGTGMGMPSVAIYVNELINGFGVKNLIRVGTCGAIQPHLEIGQVILAVGASGDSQMNKLEFGGADFAAIADYSLMRRADDVAQRLGIPTVHGNIYSTDSFYNDNPRRWETLARYGILATEMESQMLFTLAAKFGVKALTILTVSDNIVTGQVSTSKEREQSFTDMMRIALELA